MALLSKLPWIFSPPLVTNYLKLSFLRPSWMGLSISHAMCAFPRGLVSFVHALQ